MSINTSHTEGQTEQKQLCWSDRDYKNMDETEERKLDYLEEMLDIFGTLY